MRIFMYSGPIIQFQETDILNQFLHYVVCCTCLNKCLYPNLQVTCCKHVNIIYHCEAGNFNFLVD